MGKNIMQKPAVMAAILFVLGFIANYAWEHAHAVLYANYRGGGISEFVLVRATLFDAVYVALIGTPFLFIHSLRKKKRLLLPIGFAVAIAIEWYALATGRWAYNALMPIIPIIGVGLTPTVQLGLLSYALATTLDRLREGLTRKENVI